MKPTLKWILCAMFISLFIFWIICFYGCAPGVQIRHIVSKDGTQTTEYLRSVFVSQNIEGLSIVRDPATGRIDIELKGQSSESTALNSAVTALGVIAATAAGKIPKPVP